ncbi:DUF3558 domain-containing protein [Streptomyces sp. HUAS TT20]|uniref:DUF3558 domain-containing protein n=1 Tax=Streptomyces sp. HUAS TT20 TaxID=3447509 RepID=UPI0021DA5C3A|nr:DUF3558 domain-containing protein [Streptomyces sp. HUAS 15-9]UXY29101.1 DUF3558 domain-containing protein [Streptomyces sp. HUAS 15-9]
MRRKAYVTGIAALLAALLAGCTGGSDGSSPTDDANPGEAGTATVAAQPGKYRTLPEACGAVSHDTLDSLLPGIKQITDPDQRDRAYRGAATLTYDTDRKVGCRWKVESADATDHLLVDFERVVSYDNAVSDDDEAAQLFATEQTAADLPAPSASTSSPTASSSPSASASASGSTDPSSSASPSTEAASADLQPRTLDDLGDEAFLDDQLSNSGSTAEQRTVTVVFRTSNVIVTIQYDEQPTAIGTAPDSKEMQDRAQNLAGRLDDTLGG